MKNFVIILIILLIVQPVFAKSNSKILKFTEETDMQASNILYEYILNDLKMTPKEIEDFAGITKTLFEH